MPLDIKAEVEKLQTMYKEDPRQSSFNCLLLGESGYGKTFLMRTARKPVHIDSFDPGGTKGLKKEIERGEVVVDARWESEDPLAPEQFADWSKETEHRIESGYFDHFGTYCLDSATTWSDAIMNYILKKAQRAGQAPKWEKDYVPQKIQIRNHLRPILNLPCDVFLTGHMKLVEDPEHGRIFRFLTTGQGMVTIPLLFDEIYVIKVKESSRGLERTILTQPTDIYLARSRLAGDGLLDEEEEPNIKTILEKAGFDTSDKPLFR